MEINDRIPTRKINQWKSILKEGVNIKGFGAFSFDISTDKPRIANNVISATQTLEEQRIERKHINSLRPVFVPDKKFQYCLRRFAEKDELEKPKSQASVYQKGFGMTYCNPVPIAAAS